MPLVCVNAGEKRRYEGWGHFGPWTLDGLEISDCQCDAHRLLSDVFRRRREMRAIDWSLDATRELIREVLCQRRGFDADHIGEYGEEIICWMESYAMRD